VRKISEVWTVAFLVRSIMGITVNEGYVALGGEGGQQIWAGDGRECQISR